MHRIVRKGGKDELNNEPAHMPAPYSPKISEIVSRIRRIRWPEVMLDDVGRRKESAEGCAGLDLREDVAGSG